MDEGDFIPIDPSSSRRPDGSKKPRSERVNTTVFVSSLPYNATTTDLVTHFSFIGPVHHGFIAKDKETGTSKGVGYVTYAMREDADRAIEELDGGAFGDKGRKIRVLLADRRPEPGDEPKPKKVARQPNQQQQASTGEGAAPGAGPASGSGDPNAIKTLVVTGLPKDVTKNVLWKKVRKISNSIELLYPVEGEEGTAHLVFPTHNEAFQSIKKLHGHTYKGALLNCVLKKRLEKLSSSSQAGRLIVRNLSWDTTEKDLRAAFLPYGPIHTIDLPTLPSKLPPSADPSKPAPPPRARGFAFVWFLARKDAEKAMEEVNGTVIKTAKDAGKEGRPIAVDWALSKDKWEETQKGKEVKEDVKPDIKDESDSGSDNDEDEDSDDDEDEEDDNEEKPDVDMDEEPTKPKLPTVDVGATLFVRNLPFETTEQELGELFRTFGPLRYARITVDKFTGRSRGSGFVCYWNTDSADKAIAEAAKVAAETGANAMPLGGQNPFALPTVLTADPSSSLVSKIVLHGRTLDVTRAVTREQAGQMKEDGERARNASDKRNTYLMREGVVFPNSPAAANMPEAEVTKRQDAFNARKALLRSNPSLYISKTRLSIRQLPLFVTDRTLKRMAIHAIRTFDQEVESSTREPLNRAEETDETVSEAIKARTSKKKRGERETAVIQSKVVRQTEKTDAITGVGKSKGYAFLELRTHKDALKVLRYANNNPDIGKLMLEWYKIELGEMLERAKKDLQAKREGKSKSTEAEAAAAADSDSDDDDAQAKAKAKAAKAADKKDKPEMTEEDLEARVRKIESGLQERQDGMRGGKTLLLEFSIENVQVVKRRGEKIVAARDGLIGNKRKDRDDESQSHGQAAEGRGRGRDGELGESRADKKPKKDHKGGKDRKDRKDGKGRDAKPESSKPKDNDDKSKPKGAGGIAAGGPSIGSLIGRKRRMKAGK